LPKKTKKPRYVTIAGVTFEEGEEVTILPEHHSSCPGGGGDFDPTEPVYVCGYNFDRDRYTPNDGMVVLANQKGEHGFFVDVFYKGIQMVLPYDQVTDEEVKELFGLA